MRSLIIYLTLLFTCNNSVLSGQNIPAAIDSALVDSTLTRTKIQPQPSNLIFPSPQWQISSPEFGGVIAEDILDYLQLLPGVMSLDFGSVGQASPMVIRGMTPQQTRISLDGMFLTNPLTGTFDSANLPLNLLDEIGLENQAGVGMHLRKFDDKRPYSRVQFRAGDWGYSDFGVSFNLPVTPSSQFLFSGSRQEYDGYFFESPTRVINEPRDLVHSRFLARVSHQPNQKFELNVISMFNKNASSAPGPLAPDLVPIIENGRREKSRLDMRIRARLGNPGSQGKMWLAKLFFSRIGQKTFDDNLRFDNSSSVLGGELTYHLIGTKNRFELSAGFHRMSLVSEQLADRIDYQNSFSVTDILNVAERLQLTATLGVENFLADSGEFNGGKTGSTLRIHPSLEVRTKLGNSTETWFSVIQSSRHPAFAERYWPDKFYLGKASLKSERTTGGELGFKMQGEKVEIGSALFSNRVSDWIGADVRADTIAFGPNNLGSRTVSGVDVKFRWNPLRWGELGIIANYLYVTEDEPQKRLFVPEYFIINYLEYGRPLFDKYVFVRLRASGRVYGKRSGWIYNNSTDLPVLTAAQPVFVADVKASLVFSDATFTFSFENILDQQYQLRPGLFMPPRTFRFSVDWQFWD